ncbi:MAG: hypothetical protein AAF431_09690 [Pseudomonadota bacterium]
MSIGRISSIILSSVIFFSGSVIAEEGYDKAEKAAAPQITLGNGEKNWIVTEGVQRNESTLTFAEVTINGNGWLVMHPFEDGKPNGDKYVAASYLTDGKNTDVDILVHKGIETGENFIVMLHRDVNENKVLDFVFVDDRNVMDTAVFEGTTMIAHVIAAP